MSAHGEVEQFVAFPVKNVGLYKLLQLTNSALGGTEHVLDCNYFVRQIDDLLEHWVLAILKTMIAFVPHQTLVRAPE